MNTLFETASVVALDTVANESDLVRAAHQLLRGMDEVEGGKTALTFALVDITDDVIEFVHNGVQRSATVYDMLPKLRATDKDGNIKADMKATRSLFGAICVQKLGIEDEAQQDKLRQNFVTCLRAARGIVALGGRYSGGVTVSNEGDLVLPAGRAFKLFNDKSEPTEAGKAAYDMALVDAAAEARVVARLSGEEYVEPDSDTVWDMAASLPIPCTGKTHKKGRLAAFGKLPTNTEALGKLEDFAVAAGYAPAKDERAARSGTPDEKALKSLTDVTAMILAVVNPEGEAAFAPGAATDAAVAALGKACAAYAKMLKANS